MPILRVPLARTRATITLENSLWEALDRIAAESAETHPPKGLSRNDVIEDLLAWAVRAHYALMRDDVEQFLGEMLKSDGVRAAEKPGPEKRRR